MNFRKFTTLENRLQIIKNFIVSIVTVAFIFSSVMIKAIADDDLNVIGMSLLPDTMLSNEQSQCNQNNNFISGGSYERLLSVLSNNCNEKTQYTIYFIIPQYVFEYLADEIIYEKNIDEIPMDTFHYKMLVVCSYVPAILVTKEDYEILESYRKDINFEDSASDVYVEELIRFGNLRAMLARELFYISEVLPGKYDDAIDQVCGYIESLEIQDATDDRPLSFKSPYDDERIYYQPKG